MNYTVMIDNEKLKKALEILEEAIKLGNHVTYANGIEFICRERAVRISDIVDNRRVDVPVEYVPVLARRLLRAYFDIIDDYKELLRKLESGVWHV